METAEKRTPAIPELGGRVIRENEFNREVVKYLDIELKRCGFKTLLVAPTDEDTPLSTRTNLANSRKADAFISIHYNAYDGNFDGYDPEGTFSTHLSRLQGRKKTCRMCFEIPEGRNTTKRIGVLLKAISMF